MFSREIFDEKMRCVALWREQFPSSYKYILDIGNLELDVILCFRMSHLFFGFLWFRFFWNHKI